MALAKLVLALTTFAILGACLARADDLDTLYQRSLPNAVLSAATTASEVKTNLQTLRANGTWAAVDYTTGCNARRSNWPASGHWSRILDMAAAYHGGVEGADQYIGNPDVRAAIGRAMEFWFANDFSTIGNGACMDGGGKAGDLCPCGTPGLWNTNWYSNVILIPGLVGPTCLLLRDELTPTEYGNCTLITARSYTPFYRNPQPGYVSGANIIDLAVVGIAAGLLENNRTGNISRVADAYERVHNEVVIHPEDRVDGIKPDGSFQQHLGIIYDGNYGKDFSNSLLSLEIQAVGTQFQASKTIQDTLGWHLQGAQWMTFANTITKIIHWDFSVIGRMITWPVVDMQASANLKMDLNQVSSLGNSWNQADIIRFGKDLADPNPSTANAGHLNGNRMFWNSDYMVHRTGKTVTTLKMLSSRTATSECVNIQNTRGFHLSDGAVYTYTTGAEYEDMYATVDFSLIPGTTTDYGNTPLNCETTLRYGVDTYAGGVSAGDIGAAAMRYVNPLAKALSFHKAWFFFPDNVQHVLINSIKSSSTAPVFSVLDQRLHAGDIYLDGKRVASGNYSDVESLWHGGTGYVFPTDQVTEISVDAEVKTGNWSEIGVSTQPLSKKEMFTSWIVHDPSNITAPTGYSVFPATESHDAFKAKAESSTPYTVANDGTVSAAVDSAKRILGAAFWVAGGGSLFVPQMGLTLYVDKQVAVMLKLTGNGSSSGELSVADPTHESTEVNVRLVWVSKKHRRGDSAIGHHQRLGRGNGNQPEVSVHIELPTGGMAGSTVTRGFKRND